MSHEAKEARNMPWSQTTLSQTTTIGMHRIVRLPGVTREEFLQTLREKVLPLAPLPSLDRVTNVMAQALLTEETKGAVDTCVWVIYCHGVYHPDMVREKCEAMYEGIRDKLEAVGVRISFRLETLEAKWDAKQ
jgi:hypothetical protein